MRFMEALEILFDILDNPTCEKRKLSSLLKEYNFSDSIHEVAMIEIYEKLGGDYSSGIPFPFKDLFK